HFGGATPVLEEAQPIADHLFVAPDGGLDPAAPVITRRLLPPHSPSFGDALEMAVALSGLGLSHLTQHCGRAWWHDDFSIRIAIDHGAINVVLIIRAVARE